MIIEILMPALSPTMTDGNLAKWFKKEGDKISPGEVIAEIETDKATMEVEAVDAGYVGKILVAAGSNGVEVGAAIAIIYEEESDKANLDSYQIKGKSAIAHPKAEEVINQTAAQVSSSTSQIQKTTRNDNERVFASPLAKRIAEQNYIDISSVSGTGPHGRVVKADVLSVKAIPSQVSAANSRLVQGRGGYDLEPHTNMRKVIAKRLLESKQTVPHFYLNIDCNLDKLLSIREEVNADLEKDRKISVNDFIIKASAMALEKAPTANSSWTDEGILRYRDVDISVAVAIDGGLVTPIVKCANLKTLSEISKEMKELALKAREGKLKPEEYQGGGFSISNLGMFGIKQFAAIINPPQSCILAVGAGIKAPVVLGNEVKVSTVAQMTLSCDHRVVDGAVGAQFLAAFQGFIENPVKMLV